MSGAFVVAVMNTKGGTAKTTTTVALSHLIGESGAKVTLLDLDRQGDSASWAAELAELGRPLAATVQQVGDEVEPEWLADEIEAAATGADWLIIDTGPGDLRRIGAAVSAVRRYGGVCLVPTSPAKLDLARAVVTIQDQIQGKAPAAVLLVMTKALTVNLRQAQDELAELAGMQTDDGELVADFTLLDAHVPEREAAKEPSNLAIVAELYEPAAAELLERASEMQR